MDLKKHLKDLGYTQRLAAIALGVAETYLNRVINRHANSASLEERILALPRAEDNPAFSGGRIKLRMRLA